MKPLNFCKSIQKWKFAVDNNRLINLVLQGKKVATTDIYDKNHSSSINEFSFIINDEGEEVCLIKTKEIHIMPFGQMTWDLAKLEGEFENLEDWKKQHFSLYKNLDSSFNENTYIEFEIFEVVEKYY